MAVSAAGRTGHSSSRPSTLIQAVASNIARTSAAAREPRCAGVALFDELASERDELAADVAIDAVEIVERRNQLSATNMLTSWCSTDQPTSNAVTRA